MTQLKGKIKKNLQGAFLPPSTGESGFMPPWLFGIAIALVVFLYLMPETGVDVHETYGPAGRGTYIEGLIPRNPRPALWLFWILGRLPWKYDYLALMLVSIPIMIVAVHWGGGKYWKLFLSFPFFWIMAYGQIDAFIVAGLALSWWALRRERYWLMGTGIVLACFLKPQLGIIPSFYLWLLAKNKWKPLAIPGILFSISLWQWGLTWPLSWYLAAANQVAVGDWANASLHNWIGKWTLLFWLPAILLPTSRLGKLRMVIAALALSFPYFPVYEMILFLVFPTSLIEWALSGIPLFGFYKLGWLLPLWILFYENFPWVTRIASAVRARLSRFS